MLNEAFENKATHMMPMLDNDRIGNGISTCTWHRMHTLTCFGRLKDKQLVHGRKSAREGGYIHTDMHTYIHHTYIHSRSTVACPEPKKLVTATFLALAPPQARQSSLSLISLSDPCSLISPPPLHILSQPSLSLSPPQTN